MRHSLQCAFRGTRYRQFCRTLAFTLIASAVSMAGLQAEEFVVNQQVVSDTAVAGFDSESSIDGSVIDGSVIDGGGSYVGDISSVDAGIVDAGIVDGAGGAGIRRGFGRPDLFYNYYTQGYSNTANAQMYLSPLPIPPNVGHTYYTYQPFYPHHMLYAHKDRYHRYYDNGRGMNRTRAVYSYPPIKTAASNFYWNYLRLAR